MIERLSPREVDELGGYNSRVGQGIVHTPEYTAQMRRQQARFDGYWRSREGLRVVPGPPPSRWSRLLDRLGK